jgi:soluble lytic murein transglycosylase-like protein
MVLVVTSSSAARADLVFFASGRAMSVAAARLEGESIVLRLRGGGEIQCPRTLISRIEPDEVPYPEEAESGPTPTWRQGPEGISAIIEQAAAAHGVDPRLVRAVVEVESAFQPGARSASGAMGLMQLMPRTARQYGVGDPFDPQANVDAGTRHLRTLLDRFDNLALALAAYNAGEAAVRRAGGIPPWAETRAYVARVLSLLTRR